jgi:hypothetical protein
LASLLLSQKASTLPAAGWQRLRDQAAERIGNAVAGRPNSMRRSKTVE